MPRARGGFNTLVKAIPGVPGITGPGVCAQSSQGLHVRWGEEKIGIVDLRSMDVVKRLATAAKPNGSAYAALVKRFTLQTRWERRWR
jgi:hypothetical protein